MVLVDDGGVVTVHPDSRRFSAGPVPSLMSTVQSAGRVYPDLSILKLPDPLLVVICTPSTVMALLDAALPSIRNLLPLTSARDTVTAANAVSLVTAATTAMVNRLAMVPTAARARNRRLDTSFS